MSLQWGRRGMSRRGVDRRGIARSGVVLDLCTVSAALIAALGQNPETHLEVSCSILLGTTDITTLATRFEINMQANGKLSFAKIWFSCASIAGLILHQSAISITVTYALSGGLTFSSERFRGTAHLATPETVGAGSKLVLTCFDDACSLTQARPIGGLTGYLYSAENIAMINAELLNNSMSAASGTIVSGTIFGCLTWNFASSLDLITALAGARRPTYVFYHPSGKMLLTDYADVPASGWTVPINAQSLQRPITDGINQVNQIPLSGYLNTVYNDLPDQALNGVLSHSGISTIMSLTDPEIVTLCSAIVSESKKAVYEWRTALNPFIFPGESVVLTLKSGGTATVRVESVTDTGGWPGGFWSNWKGRAA